MHHPPTVRIGLVGIVAATLVAPSALATSAHASPIPSPVAASSPLSESTDAAPFTAPFVLRQTDGRYLTLGGINYSLADATFYAPTVEFPAPGTTGRIKIVGSNQCIDAVLSSISPNWAGKVSAGPCTNSQTYYSEWDIGLDGSVHTKAGTNGYAWVAPLMGNSMRPGLPNWKGTRDQAATIADMPVAQRIAFALQHTAPGETSAPFTTQITSDIDGIGTFTAPTGTTIASVSSSDGDRITINAGKTTATIASPSGGDKHWGSGAGDRQLTVSLKVDATAKAGTTLTGGSFVIKRSPSNGGATTGRGDVSIVVASPARQIALRFPATSPGDTTPETTSTFTGDNQGVLTLTAPTGTTFASTTVGGISPDRKTITAGDDGSHWGPSQIAIKLTVDADAKPGTTLTGGTITVQRAAAAGGDVTARGELSILVAEAEPAPVTELKATWTVQADVSKTGTVSGIGDDGATITVTHGSTVLGTTTVEDGVWSLDIDPIGPGVYSLGVTQTKGLTDLSDTVDVDFGAAIQVASPVDHELVAGATVFTGTGAPGAEITVLAGNGSAIATTSVGSDGTWTATDTTNILPDGSYSVLVESRARGALQTTALASLDHVPANYARPVVTDPAPGSTISTATPVISGSGTPGATIRVANPSGGYYVDTRVDGSGHWSKQVAADLAEGLNTLAVTQIVNPGGHIDTIPYSLTVRISSLTPVHVTEPIDYALVAGTITTTGTGQNGATVQIIAGGGQVIGSSPVVNGTWSISDTSNLLPMGRYQYTVTQTLGKQSNTALASIDHVPANYVPAEVTAPATGTAVTTADPDYSGTGTPGATIYLKTTSGDVVARTTVNGQGRWTAPSLTSLSAGTNNLHLVQVVNPGGHTDTTDYTVTYATAPLSVTSPLDNALIAGTITTTGTGQNGATVQVVAGGGVVVGSTTVVNGTWSITDTSGLLPFGSFFYRVVQTIDGQAPTEAMASVDHVPGDYAPLRVTSPTDGDTVSTTPVISGKASPNATVYVYEGTTLLGALETSASGGAFSKAVTLTPGPHDLTVKQSLKNGGHIDTVDLRVTAR